MSFRTVYGKTVSAEGWRMCNADECTWVKVPGTNVSIQVRSGIPATILGAFVARFNQVVEPVRDADTACYTVTNSVSTSNHLSAVAVDIDWDSHPFHVRGTFGDRLPKVRQVLAEFRDCVWWGGDWTDPIDEMHFELNFPEGHWAGEPERSEFIIDVDQRLIDLADDLQAGYLGIYEPGQPDAPPPPPQLSKADEYALQIIGEGQRRGVTPRGQQIALSVALVESGMKVYANSNVPESLNIPHDAVGSDHDSLGLFQQRCPMWGPAAVLMDPAQSAGLFYDRLVTLDYNDTSRPPGDYAADVQRPAAQYRGRYQERMGDSIALYNRLATDAGDDDLSAEDSANIAKILAYLQEPLKSRSAVRPPGQGTIGNLRDFVLWTNGSTDEAAVTGLAREGHPGSLQRLRDVAAMVDPDRPGDAEIAQTILADIFEQPVVSPASTAVPAPAVEAATGIDTTAILRQLDGAHSEIARLRADNAQLLNDNATLRLAAAQAPVVSTELATVTPESKTPGQVTGDVVDSVTDYTKFILSLDAPQRQGHLASLKALQPSNGSQP